MGQELQWFYGKSYLGFLCFNQANHVTFKMLLLPTADRLTVCLVLKEHHFPMSFVWACAFISEREAVEKRFVVPWRCWKDRHKWSSFTVLSHWFFLASAQMSRHPQPHCNQLWVGSRHRRLTDDWHLPGRESGPHWFSQRRLYLVRSLVCSPAITTLHLSSSPDLNLLL